uniref:cytokine receptor common subunit gamma-like n=1 Tax=Scatophagus argus TaxID=75038 RepID=UPI001ED8289B|nr:cytokine receptor common subunit gamma-like [Scatophagus argus]XP_046266668.1 cytokine receptor common subunit gamma-like [Scatophagus argus]
MMATRLLLLLCLAGHVLAKEPPDVDCLVVHLNYVQCYWNKQGTPDVNYTFYGWFHHDKNISECTTYLSENNTKIGCNHPYEKKLNRFQTFYTKLVHGEDTFERKLELKQKVKLYPPTNLTVQMGSDSNLRFYWNQTSSNCVESEIRCRINNKEWDVSLVSIGLQSYCINMPSKNSVYELQVRSKLGSTCAESLYWSDWSEPVVWGSNNSTDPNQKNELMFVWTPVFFLLGTLTFILLVMILLHHERVRIILMPVVPKPSLISHNMQDWLQLSKGLKESFNPNYNDRACPVREYCHVSQSDSESSDSSTSSITTDQTDCSVLITVDESDLSTPCSSSTSAVLVSSGQKDQVSA